jgi:hypothetical protein
MGIMVPIMEPFVNHQTKVALWIVKAANDDQKKAVANKVLPTARAVSVADSTGHWSHHGIAITIIPLLATGGLQNSAGYCWVVDQSCQKPNAQHYEYVFNLMR